MSHMTGHNERECSYSDFVSVGSARAVPRFFIQTAKHGDVRQANQPQLTQKVFELDVTIRRRQHVIVLIKARQVLFLAARDAQRAITKHAFAINQMTDDFDRRPLIGFGTPLQRLEVVTSDELADPPRRGLSDR